MTLSTPQLRDGYRMMLLARGFDRKCEELFQQGIIRGSLHMCIGQEATGAGAALALRDDEILITNYRGHGQALSKGISPRAAMAAHLSSSHDRYTANIASAADPRTAQRPAALRRKPARKAA